MSGPLDLGALLARAQADDDLIGIWVNKREVAALVRAVRAAQTVVEEHAADNPFVGISIEVLHDALAPFTDDGGGGWPYRGDQP